jgi:hypothetical protein
MAFDLLCVAVNVRLRLPLHAAHRRRFFDRRLGMYALSMGQG